MRGFQVVVTAILCVGFLSSNCRVTSFSLIHTPRQQQLPFSLLLSPQQAKTVKQHMNYRGLTVLNSGSEPPQIISPFDHSADNETDDDNNINNNNNNNEILDLTYENVELVLDGMRHFLIQDGGNVIIDEIDGPIVKLQLQGNCGTCPSSTQTMKMGLERGLKERIPEIQEVIQSLPEGPPLVEEQIEVVLDGVRPFLQIVGGNIVLNRIEGLDSIQPNIILEMSGSSASLNSVKLEIAQRLQRHFMMSGLQIHWKDE